MIQAIHTYPPKEERLNVISHAIGIGLALPALVLLILKSIELHQPKVWIGFMVYGLSLLVLYMNSTLYHAVQKPKWRNPLNLWDHLSIYLLIAGTYTPYTLLILPPIWGYSILITVWLSAIIGIILKSFFFGRYNTLSAILYVVMGWIVVVAIVPLYQNLGFLGTFWLFFGGIFYTLGAVIYLFDKKIPYNHAIFHLLVLGGSISHFISIYYYLIPQI